MMKRKIMKIASAFIFNKDKRRKFREKHIPPKNIKSIEFNNLLSVTNLAKNVDVIMGAMADPNGLGFLKLMMHNAHIPSRYEFIFHNIKEGDLFIDCGANVGLVSDIALKQGAVVHAFEPNVETLGILRRKYKNTPNFYLHEDAVADENGTGDFFYSSHHAFDAGASLVNYGGLEGFEQADIVKGTFKVNIIRLTEFLKNNILNKQERIYMLKLDVEGAEFGIIEDIINTGIYKNIDHIACETHARFFEDGDAKLAKIEKMIADDGIRNIYLDWI